jgi:hypothetical protein
MTMDKTVDTLGTNRTLSTGRELIGRAIVPVRFQIHSFYAPDSPAMTGT